MHIEHFEKGVRYTDKELLMLARKLGKMATYCGRLKDASSVIRVEAEKRETKKATDGIKVMLTIELPKKTLRSESRKKTILEAVDRAVEKMEPQLARYKELHTGRGIASKERKHVRKDRALRSLAA